MLGLAFLFFSALTILLYCGWIALIFLIFRAAANSVFPVFLRYFVALLLALVPLYKAVVYPLVRTECKSRGGDIIYSKSTDLVNALVIDGKHYFPGSLNPVLNMFSSKDLNSIGFEDGALYGESHEIVGAAQIYHEKAFSLKLSNFDDVACGPYYKYASQKKNIPQLAAENCLAIDRLIQPRDYIRISKTKETKNSWRTAFRGVEWTSTKFQITRDGKSTLLRELREFDYEGLKFPLFFNVSSVGNFSCKAGKLPDDVLSELLVKSDRNSGSTQSEAFYLSKLEALKDKFWGFRTPDRVNYFKVGITDVNHVSARQGRISMELRIPKREAAVLISANSSESIDFIIRPEGDQEVYVEQRSTGIDSTILGIPKSHVWRFDESEKLRNPLLMFYIGRISEISQAAEGHCWLAIAPKNRTSTVELGVCDHRENGMRLVRP